MSASQVITDEVAAAAHLPHDHDRMNGVTMMGPPCCNPKHMLCVH